jgi:hypothetical protein
MESKDVIDYAIEKYRLFGIQILTEKGLSTPKIFDISVVL